MPQRTVLFLLFSSILSSSTWADAVVLICDGSMGSWTRQGSGSHEISFDEAAGKVWVDGYLFQNSPSTPVRFTKTIITVSGFGGEWILNRVSGTWSRNIVPDVQGVAPLGVESGTCRVPEKTKF
jgi:hypothetical protein